MAYKPTDDGDSKKMHHSALSAIFPTRVQIQWLATYAKISELRFCSVPDEATGELPPLQLIKFGAPWQGKCQVLMRRNPQYAATEHQWTEIFSSLAMDRICITEEQLATVGKRKSLWRFFGDMYNDSRTAELKQNLMILNFKQFMPHVPIESLQYLITPQAAPLPASAPPPAHDALQDLGAYLDARQLQERQELFREQGPEAPKRKRGPYKTKRKEAEKAMLSRASQPSMGVRISLSQGSTQQPAAAQEQEKAKKQRRQQQGGLSLPQMVAQRACPQPPGSEWKTVLSEFLMSPDHFGKGGKRVASVIKALLPAQCSSKEYFSVSKKSGLGLLFPSPELQDGPDWPSTLELHRCALACEKAAEDTLRSLGNAVSRNGEHAVMAALAPQLTADLQAIWAFGGGLRGEGLHYWPQRVDAGYSLFNGVDVYEARVYPALLALKNGRGAAFSRMYWVPSDLHWGLPYLCKLFFLREEAPPAMPLSHADVRRTFESLTTLRVNALRMDREPLVRYARDLLAYAERLAEMAACLGMSSPSLREIRRTLDAAVSLQHNCQSIRCRISEETRELQSILVHLGIAACPAAQQAEALSLALGKAMSTDSHQQASTKHLAPSPSLPGAVYNPGAYLRQA